MNSQSHLPDLQNEPVMNHRIFSAALHQEVRIAQYEVSIFTNYCLV